MMFERFTDGARQVVVRAQEDARRLGHNYIGCEHLLLAAAETGEPAGVVLRDQGVTPERVEAEILRTIGQGSAGADPLRGLDREALAAIGIDLDVVRARIEAAFGPDALDRAVLAHRRAADGGGRPAWRKGPVAELMRRRRRRRARRNAPLPAGPPRQRPASPGPAPGGHIPFTPRAKKTLQLSLREAKTLHDNYIGVQHLALALLALQDGTVPGGWAGNKREQWRCSKPVSLDDSGVGRAWLLIARWALLQAVGLLASYSSDELEVLIDVEDGEPRGFSCRGDQQVRDRRAAVLPVPGQVPQHFNCALFRRRGQVLHRHQRQRRPVQQFAHVRGGSGRVSGLQQRDRGDMHQAALYALRPQFLFLAVAQAD